MNIKIFNPSGMLDNTKGNELREQIDSITKTLEEKPEKILVDLKEVTFMDSAGLGALVAIQKSLRGMGIEFFICSLGDQVKLIFELTKMRQVFKAYEDRSAFEMAMITQSN